MATKHSKAQGNNPRTSLPDIGHDARRCLAPFALASSGTLLINVVELSAIDPAALKGRRLFIGVELTAVERRRLRHRLTEAGDEVCSKIVGAERERRPTTRRGSRS